MLAATLTLSAFTVSAAIIALVPLMAERGYTSTQAAWALGLGGADRLSAAPFTPPSLATPAPPAAPSRSWRSAH